MASSDQPEKGRYARMVNEAILKYLKEEEARIVSLRRMMPKLKDRLGVAPEPRPVKFREFT